MAHIGWLVTLTTLYYTHIVFFGRSIPNKTIHNSTENKIYIQIFENYPYYEYLIITGIEWILSFGAIFYLYYLLDPIKKFRISKFVFKCIGINPIWKQEEGLWMTFIDSLLNNFAEFEIINSKAKQEFGEGFLEFAVRTRKFHLAEVNPALNINLSKPYFS